MGLGSIMEMKGWMVRSSIWFVFLVVFLCLSSVFRFFLLSG